jgi:hypothetical protein
LLDYLNIIKQRYLRNLNVKGFEHWLVFSGKYFFPFLSRTACGSLNLFLENDVFLLVLNSKLRFLYTPYLI